MAWIETAPATAAPASATPALAPAARYVIACSFRVLHTSLSEQWESGSGMSSIGGGWR
jgi:hypothetical protein